VIHGPAKTLETFDARVAAISGLVELMRSKAPGVFVPEFALQRRW